jgi:hypothetical protein
MYVYIYVFSEWACEFGVVECEYMYSDFVKSEDKNNDNYYNHTYFSFCFDLATPRVVWL